MALQQHGNHCLSSEYEYLIIGGYQLTPGWSQRAALGCKSAKSKLVMFCFMNDMKWNNVPTQCLITFKNTKQMQAKSPVRAPFKVSDVEAGNLI